MADRAAAHGRSGEQEELFSGSYAGFDVLILQEVRQAKKPCGRCVYVGHYRD
jgi:hypothetical protein